MGIVKGNELSELIDFRLCPNEESHRGVLEEIRKVLPIAVSISKNIVICAGVNVDCFEFEKALTAELFLTYPAAEVHLGDAKKRHKANGELNFMLYAETYPYVSKNNDYVLIEVLGNNQIDIVLKGLNMSSTRRPKVYAGITGYNIAYVVYPTKKPLRSYINLSSHNDDIHFSNLTKVTDLTESNFVGDVALLSTQVNEEVLEILKSNYDYVIRVICSPEEETTLWYPACNVKRSLGESYLINKFSTSNITLKPNEMAIASSELKTTNFF